MRLIYRVNIIMLLKNVDKYYLKLIRLSKTLTYETVSTILRNISHGYPFPKMKTENYQYMHCLFGIITFIVLSGNELF